MSDLATFLRDCGAAPFRFGELDCAMMVADWVEARLGIDPAAELRGAYGDAAGFAAILARAGGLVPVFDRLAGAAGMIRTPSPSDGDIGVVTRRRGAAGAIRRGGQWAIRTPEGIVLENAPCVAAWAFPMRSGSP